jgi:hypothetical protein
MTLEQFEMEYRSLAAGWLAMSAAAKRAALTKLGILESAVDNFERRMPRRYCRDAALRVDISSSLGNRTTIAEGVVEPFRPGSMPSNMAVR